MRYIIMADGDNVRWKNHNNITKHLAVVDGETLIARTVRLLRENGATDIIITSHDCGYKVDGAKLHQPLSNNREIDRFTKELITDDICFLYGDVYYSPDVLTEVCSISTDELLFFGSRQTIVAIIVRQADLFLSALSKVISAIESGEIADGKGWQVYRAHNNLPLNTRKITNNFVFVDNATRDINTARDYDKLIKQLKNAETT
jgi:GTP:adenosylcobinamide-phosphate guanylyltransferase